MAKPKLHGNKKRVKGDGIINLVQINQISGFFSDYRSINIFSNTMTKWTMITYRLCEQSQDERIKQIQGNIIIDVPFVELHHELQTDSFQHH